MKIFTFILFYFIIICCDKMPDNIAPSFNTVDINSCIDSCIDKKFKDFNSISRFGGSSTMSGLHQSEIFDTVLKYCTNIMKNKSCVRWSTSTSNFKMYDDIYFFSPEYGFIEKDVIK